MMNKANFFDVMYTHTEGEPTGIVHSGISYPFGSNILEKRRFLEREYDWLRKALMREPRGHNDMFGVFLTPPSGPDTDAGMIWMDGDRFVDMCGHGTIALGMAMVATGMRPPVDGDTTTIRFETTAGLVTAEVTSEGDRVTGTQFENVPAFVAAEDITVELPEIGELKADVAFGGNYFSQINLAGTALKIRPENGSRLRELALIAREQINAKVDIQHPTQTHIEGVPFVTFYHEPDRADSLYRCVHVFSDGKLDRSPGGTGTTAMVAMFEKKGAIKIGQPIRSEGLLGSGQFEGCAQRETTVGNQRALAITIKGTAKIVGFAKWLIDREDPVGAGFVIN
jgi:proline racemase